jgi:hypothetical protein
MHTNENVSQLLLYASYFQACATVISNENLASDFHTFRIIVII